MGNLYLLTTKGLGNYHVLANSPTEAQDSLKRILDEQNYGNPDDRRIVNIGGLQRHLVNRQTMVRNHSYLTNQKRENIQGANVRCLSSHGLLMKKVSLCVENVVGEFNYLTN
jgi:hypothetical protein